MSVHPHFPRGRQSAAALRIIALLHDAAALVLDDPDATQIRMSEASTLLNALHIEPHFKGVTRVLAPWQAQRVQSYIAAHLDQKIRIESLAGQLQLSAGHFFRAFRGTFGMTPHAFIMQCRTKQAMALLSCTDEPISQIAAACGFADQAHLSRIFLRNIGMPPGAWRRLKRGDKSILDERPRLAQ